MDDAEEMDYFPFTFLLSLTSHFLDYGSILDAHG